MEQVTNLGEVRKRKKRKKVLHMVAAIALILVVTYGAAVMMNHEDAIGPSSLTALFQGGSGYPVEAPGGRSKGLYAAGGNLAVVNDSDLFMYNTKGSQVFDVKHHMANPLAKSEDNYFLIYDRGGKSYAMYNRVSPVVDGKTNYPIYAGAVSGNGSFAIAARSEDYLSQVTVYSRNSEEKYSWNYSDKMVTDVALSAGGDNMAVAALYAKDGILCSQLLLYRRGELAATRDFEGEVLCSLLYTNEDILTGVTDNRAFSITGKGKLLGEYNCQGQGMAAYAITPQSTVLLLGSYQQNGGYDLVSLTSDMLTQSTAKVQGTIHQLCADESSAYLLAGNRFLQYDLELGTWTGEVLADYVYDILPMGKYVYAITNEQILRTVKEDISQWPQNQAKPETGEGEGENNLQQQENQPNEELPLPQEQGSSGAEQQDDAEKEENNQTEVPKDNETDLDGANPDEGEAPTEGQKPNQKTYGAPGL